MILFIHLHIYIFIPEHHNDKNMLILFILSNLKFT